MRDFGPRYYDIDGTPIEDVLDWARIFEARKAEPDGDWRIGWDKIGDFTVSTVWLGLDHSWGFGGPPMIFETMVFGGALDEECERYSTRAQAIWGHARWVALVQAEHAIAAPRE